MGISGFAWCWLLFWGQSNFSEYSPSRFKLHVIENITSPTGLLVRGDKLFMTADHLDPKPGLYGLHERGDLFKAGLLKILPQQHIDGLGVDGKGNFRLVSGRLFSAHKADWVNQIILLSQSQYDLVDIWKPDLPNRCSDGNYDCGLVGMVNLPSGLAVLVSRKSPSRVYLMKQVSGKWERQKAQPLALNGQYVTVSDVMLLQGKLVFLMKNKWALGSLDPAELESDSFGRLELEPMFDFSVLKKSFRVGSSGFLYKGLAEAFAIHPDGRLLVVLNNRGYSFKKTPDDVLGEAPRILAFSPAKAPAQEHKK